MFTQPENAICRLLLALSQIMICAFGAAACADAAVAIRTPSDSLPAIDQPRTTVENTEGLRQEGKLLLATTTSTQDSGLLDYLLPEFTRQFGVRVDVIAVGTGQALQLGRDGNADVLLVHSRAMEDEFMAAGHGVRREEVMYNDFIVVGPAEDPARLRGMTSAADGFRQLAEAQVPFVSRGDQSGTHAKELSLWRAAGVEPFGEWYISAGQGMGEVLSMAAELHAYTLSDRATYLARRKHGLELVVLIEISPYSIPMG